MVKASQIKANNAINSDLKSYAALRFLGPDMAGVNVRFWMVLA